MRNQFAAMAKSSSFTARLKAVDAAAAVAGSVAVSLRTDSSPLPTVISGAMTGDLRRACSGGNSLQHEMNLSCWIDLLHPNAHKLDLADTPACLLWTSCCSEGN